MTRFPIDNCSCWSNDIPFSKSIDLTQFIQTYTSVFSQWSFYKINERVLLIKKKTTSKQRLQRISLRGIRHKHHINLQVLQPPTVISQLVAVSYPRVPCGVHVTQLLVFYVVLCFVYCCLSFDLFSVLLCCLFLFYLWFESFSNIKTTVNKLRILQLSITIITKLLTIKFIFERSTVSGFVTSLLKRYANFTNLVYKSNIMLSLYKVLKSLNIFMMMQGRFYWRLTLIVHL